MSFNLLSHWNSLLGLSVGNRRPEMGRLKRERSTQRKISKRWPESQPSGMWLPKALLGHGCQLPWRLSFCTKSPWTTALHFRQRQEHTTTPDVRELTWGALEKLDMLPHLQRPPVSTPPAPGHQHHPSGRKHRQLSTTVPTSGEHSSASPPRSGPGPPGAVSLWHGAKSVATERIISKNNGRKKPT